MCGESGRQFHFICSDCWPVHRLRKIGDTLWESSTTGTPGGMSVENHVGIKPGIIFIKSTEFIDTFNNCLLEADSFLSTTAISSSLNQRSCKKNPTARLWISISFCFTFL